MNNFYITVVLIISFSVLSIQIFSSFVAYNIYKFNRNKKNWFGIIIANAIIASQDFIFLIYIRGLSVNQFGLLSGMIFLLLPIAISIFMLIGLLSMQKSFFEFDIIQKEANGKFKRFNRKSKK